MSEPLQKHSRLPRKYEPKAQPPKGDVLPYHALVGVDPQELLRRYLSDESTIDIAKSYGISRQALNQYLLRNAEEDWKDAQVMRAIARKEAAEDAMEIAADPLALAKARELLKAAQWDLERTCRRIYGEDKQTQTPITPILNITISSDQTPSGRPNSISVALAHAPALDQPQVIDVQPQQSSAAPGVDDALAKQHPVESSG